MPARKRVCPFSPSRLHDLYWREGFTPNQIAQKAAEADQITAPAYETVRRWLKEAGIALKTKSEAMHQRVQQEPAKWERSRQKATEIHTRLARWHDCPLGDASQMQTPQAQSKLRAYHKARRALRETRLCAVCGKKITKPVHRFTAPPELTACSRSCRMAMLAKLKTQAAPPVIRTCGHCGLTFPVHPSYSKRRPDVIYCSKTCSNRGRAQQKHRAPESDSAFTIKKFLTEDDLKDFNHV